MSSAEKDSPPSPLDRTILQVSGAPERGRQLGSQSWGSRWPFTHCPVHDANQQMDTDPRGSWTVVYRAEREVRQEQQNRSKVLLLRKLCFSLSWRGVCWREGKGQVWVPIWSKRNVKWRVGFHLQQGNRSSGIKDWCDGSKPVSVQVTDEDRLLNRATKAKNPEDCGLPLTGRLTSLKALCFSLSSLGMAFLVLQGTFWISDFP